MLNSMKPHIGIFGKRNVGKSSVINSLTGQEISIVSEHAGTTTDVVYKSIELYDIGPVVFMDTAGIDDDGELGHKRVLTTLKAIKKIDLAVMVMAADDLGRHELELIKTFTQKKIAWIMVRNKVDIFPVMPDKLEKIKNKYFCDILTFSCKWPSKDKGRDIIGAIKENLPEKSFNMQSIMGDLVQRGSHVLMICPVDSEAPEGRLILPQVQAIRDALDNDCIITIAKEHEIDLVLKKINPDLVITDSQAFFKVSAAVPADIPLTSFSILFARFKGDFETFIHGTRQIDNLKNGDKVLILESCTHHVNEDDIGMVKIPRWIRNYTGMQLDFETVSGFDEIPGEISDYKLVIQCGGCMFTGKQLLNRVAPAIEKKIPVTNYGMAIAYALGIFDRAISVFGH